MMLAERPVPRPEDRRCHYCGRSDDRGRMMYSFEIQNWVHPSCVVAEMTWTPSKEEILKVGRELGLLSEVPEARRWAEYLGLIRPV